MIKDIISYVILGLVVLMVVPAVILKPGSENGFLYDACILWSFIIFTCAIVGAIGWALHHVGLT